MPPPPPPQTQDCAKEHAFCPSFPLISSVNLWHSILVEASMNESQMVRESFHFTNSFQCGWYLTLVDLSTAFSSSGIMETFAALHRAQEKLAEKPLMWYKNAHVPWAKGGEGRRVMLIRWFTGTSGSSKDAQDPEIVVSSLQPFESTKYIFHWPWNNNKNAQR